MAITNITKLKTITMVFSSLVFLTFISSPAFATNQDVTFTVNNTSTILELSVPSSVDLRLTPTRGSAFNTANLNIGVGTNNSTGYSLSMTATSTDLTRTASITDGNNNTSTPTIPTISTTYSPASFESSNDTINKWGFKLSTASNYGPMVTTTQTLKTTEGPSNATGSDVILNFAAKVDTTQPSGTYQTTLNFTAVTNAVIVPTNYTISYNDNSNSGSNIPANQTGTITENTTVNISDNTPTRNKYNFVGWCTVDNSVNTAGCSGDIYQPGDNYTITYTGNTISAPLYAVWEGTTMQTFSCVSLSTDEKTTLTDERENSANSYLVGKAHDGRCWMLQNLNLGSSVANGGSITVTKVNNTTQAASGTFNLSGKIPNSFTSSTNNGYSNTNDSSQFACNDTWGCFYNWTAATAGSGLSSTTTGEATYSICPVGWSLPNSQEITTLLDSYDYSFDNGSYTDLYTHVISSQNNNASGKIPGFTLASFYSSGTSLTDPGWFSAYWLRTASDGSNAYISYVDTDSNGHGTTTRSKYYGIPIRCVTY